MAEQTEGHLAISVKPQTTNDTTNASQSKADDSSGENGLQKALGCLDYVVILIAAIIAVIAIPAIVLVVAPIIAIPVLSLMLALYFIALIVQAFRSDDDNEVGQLLGSLARWLWIFFALISMDLLLSILIFGVSPSLKHLTFHGMSVARWIGVLAIISVFLTYSMSVRYLLGYRRLQRRDQSEETVHLYEAIIGAINSLLYLLALFSIIRVAPLLKEHETHGHPTHKWVRMILLVVLGHFVVRIITSLIVALLRYKYNMKAAERRLRNSKNRFVRRVVRGLFRVVHVFTRKDTRTDDQWTRYIVYYGEGLRTSFNFVLTSLLVLLTWILYFGSRLDRSSLGATRVVYDFGWWTFACVLASAVLWLVKSGIILGWKARVVYDRFDKKILGAAKQLYLIAMIAGPKFDILGFWKKEEGGGEDRIENNVNVTDELNETSTNYRKVKQQSHDEKGNKTGENSTNTEDPGKEGKEAPITSETATTNREGEDTSKRATEADQDVEDKERPYTEDPGKEDKEVAITVETAPANREREGTREGATEADKDVERAKERTRKTLVRDDGEERPYTSDIVRMARYFMAAEEPLSKDGFVVEFVAKFHEENPLPKNPEPIDGIRIRTLHGQMLEEEDSKLFKKLAKDKYGVIVPDKWIIMYHKGCLELGRTIAGAMEVVNCLDNIMIVIIVAATIIVWLLLTDTATTKLLIAIVSPIAGASFIFGESCRNLFNGIMFTYVMHPFDVGDLCTIKKTQLEVKRIGVWKTIFSKVGTTDDVVYPNAVLANLSIINHKGELDPNDSVELTLNSTTTKDQIKNLKSNIEWYLDNNDIGCKKHPHGVLVKDVGKYVTIAVHFKHDEATIEAVMSTDGLQKKREKKDQFLLKMKTYLDDLDIKEGTNAPSSASAVDGRK